MARVSFFVLLPNIIIIEIANNEYHILVPSNCKICIPPQEGDDSGDVDGDSEEPNDDNNSMTMTRTSMRTTLTRITSKENVCIVALIGTPQEVYLSPIG